MEFLIGLQRWINASIAADLSAFAATRDWAALLDRIQPDHWLPEYTTDLLDLLNVLGRLVLLEPAQADLLDRICAARLLSADDLRAAGALPRPEEDEVLSDAAAGG